MTTTGSSRYRTPSGTRPATCEGVRAWHSARAEAYATLIRTEVAPDGTVGFLAWGDPALYDSTIRIVESVAALGVDLELTVVPGISSVSLLAARHRIALNRIGQPVHITTGRRLAAEYSPELGDVVVMLDGDLSLRRAGREASRSADLLGRPVGAARRGAGRGPACLGSGGHPGHPEPNPRGTRLGDGYLPPPARMTRL